MRLLNGSNELRPSDNPWDSLGPGIYFWEQNPQRALAYAVECAVKLQKFSGNDRLHIEICVRDPSMIKGYFLPRPVEEFNPYLNSSV
jgi:hypothetical protein